MSVFGYDYKNGFNRVALLKYDGKSGEHSRVERVQGANGWENRVEGIERADFRALFDLENVEVGWFLFKQGQAPSMVLVRKGDTLPLKPSDEHKFGCRLMLKLANTCCGTEDPIRELSGNSTVFLDGLAELMKAYEAGKAEHPDQLPVVTLGKSLPITTKNGTNKQPVYQIAGWSPRGDLVFVPKATGAMNVCAPLAPATKEPELSDSLADFG